MITFGVLALLILSAVWIDTKLKSDPTDCYLEYGKLTKTWKDGLFYFQFINREGHNRTIWITDNFPEQINHSVAVNTFNATKGENIIIRWCYIPIVDGIRGRGAWYVS